MHDRIEIVGDRIVLRQLLVDDLTDDIMQWFADSELMKFYTNSGRKIDKTELSHSIREGIETGLNYTFGIYDKANGIIIGTVKLGPINKVHRIADLATLIGNHEYLGKGFSSEAIRLGSELAFKKFGIRRLYGGMYLSNIASIKAYLKAGWIAEGRLKGFYWVDGKNEDRLLVGCYNPDYFTHEEIECLKAQSHFYYE